MTNLINLDALPTVHGVPAKQECLKRLLRHVDPDTIPTFGPMLVFTWDPDTDTFGISTETHDLAVSDDRVTVLDEVASLTDLTTWVDRVANTETIESIETVGE